MVDEFDDEFEHFLTPREIVVYPSGSVERRQVGEPTFRERQARPLVSRKRRKKQKGKKKNDQMHR